MNKPDIDAIRKKHFPMNLGNGFVAKQSTRKEVREFMNENYAKVFSPEQNTQRPTLAPDRKAKLEGMSDLYDDVHHEYLLIHAPDGAIAGWHMGEMEDWLTFYMRNTGILPVYQGRGVYKQLLAKFEAFLEEIGYEKVSSQHQATNRSILIAKLKVGYVIAGFELTEIWGPLVKLVKALTPERRKRFYEMYGDLKHMEPEKKPQE